MESEVSPIASRRRVLPSATIRSATALGAAFVTVTHDPLEQPFEVFVNVGKAGTETYAAAEVLGRLISLALRIESPVPRVERAREIAMQLANIGATANGSALPSIPDAIAGVLMDEIEQTLPDAPDEKEAIKPPPVETAASQPLVLPVLPTLQTEPKSRKKSMDTMKIILSPAIQTAAEQLAERLAATGPIAAHLSARQRLDTDSQARALLERLSSAQSDLRVRQASGNVTQSDINDLRDLQRQVQANPVIMDYANTQQAAITYLPQVNQEISQLIGIDFASLAGPASC